MAQDVRPTPTGTHERLVRRFYLASVSAAWTTCVIAAVVLTGWGIHWDLLTRLVPGVVPMNPMTALCFLLSGIALTVRHSPRAGPLGLSAAQACATGLVLIGLARLGDALFGWDTGIDLTLFGGALDNADLSGPIRMIPHTAVGFVMIGLAALLIDYETRGGEAPSQYFSLGGVVISLLAVLGYVYSVTTFLGLGSLFPMPPHTALTFAIISLGMLFARPERGLMRLITSDNVGGVMVRLLLPPSIIIPPILGWFRLMGQQAGFYTDEFGAALYAVGTILLFDALVWWIAVLLYHTDEARRVIDNRLRASESRLQAILDNSPAVIYLKDTEGRLLLVNRRYETLFHFSRDQVVGRTDYDLFPPEMAAIFRTNDQTVMQSRVALEFEEAAPQDDGVHTFLSIKFPIFDMRGVAYAICGISTDITERKRAERELKRQHRLLEDAVGSEREAHGILKQAQSQLVQSEKLAALGQMVAGVAHEINNPLAFVSNNVAVLQRDVKAIHDLIEIYARAEPLILKGDPDLHGEIKELSERIDLQYTLDNLRGIFLRSRDGLKRIQQIVKDLRDFARLDESELQEADLNAGIQSTVNIIMGRAKSKQVRLDMHLGDLPPVACYPAKINQVVMNLTANAIDACDEGGTVTVSSGIEWDKVRIDVSDTGCGISREVRQRIFDPFFTTKPQGEGTGLGLSISYGIVQDHGGSIEVDSAPGQGSRFTVWLPMRRLDQ